MIKTRKRALRNFVSTCRGHFKQTRYKHVLNERQIDIGVKQPDMTAPATTTFSKMMSLKHQLRFVFFSLQPSLLLFVFIRQMCAKVHTIIWISREKLYTAFIKQFSQNDVLLSFLRCSLIFSFFLHFISCSFFFVEGLNVLLVHHLTESFAIIC